MVNEHRYDDQTSSAGGNQTVAENRRDSFPRPANLDGCVHAALKLVVSSSSTIGTRFINISTSVPALTTKALDDLQLTSLMVESRA